MKEITIRNFAPGDERRMAEVQARCVAACPDTGRFPPAFWLGPGFEDGQNIFCAVDEQDQLLGYAAISPSYISRHLKARILWLDLRADPQHAGANAVKEALFERAWTRAHELVGRWPGERVALSATYFAQGQASIDYLKSKDVNTTFLNVDSENKTAYALYRSIGFVKNDVLLTYEKVID